MDHAANQPLRHLAICEGIGGFSLGLKLALGDQVCTVGHVERDGFAVSVLLARMADETLEPAPVFCGSLEELDGRELCGEVDVITAGYPCQPYSDAGAQRGDEDPRAIWPQIARLVGEIRPAVVLLENVARSAFRGPWRDLRRMGYTVPSPVIVSAAELGAGHLRRRWFVAAYRDDERHPEHQGPKGTRRETRTAVAAELPVADRCGVGAGLQPGRRSGQGGAETPGAGPSAGHRDRVRGLQPEGSQLDVRRRARHSGWWAREPRVARLVHGVPARLVRSRSTGNAVVPAVVAKAWEVLTGMRSKR